jgi:hypothetical protein
MSAGFFFRSLFILCFNKRKETFSIGFNFFPVKRLNSSGDNLTNSLAFRYFDGDPVGEDSGFIIEAAWEELMLIIKINKVITWGKRNLIKKILVIDKVSVFYIKLTALRRCCCFSFTGNRPLSFLE